MSTKDGVLRKSLLFVFTVAFVFLVALTVVLTAPNADESNDIRANLPSNLTAVFGDRLAYIQLPHGWEWQSPNLRLDTFGNTRHVAIYTNNNTLHAVDVYAHQAPFGINAVFGQYLSEVALPNIWEWQSKNDMVGSVGVRTHYGIISLNGNTYIVPIAVTVFRAHPNIQIPYDITAFYGQRLFEVGLPNGWIWSTPQFFVGDIGPQLHTVIYIPHDYQNYLIVSKDITITVVPLVAIPDYQVPPNRIALYGQRLFDVNLLCDRWSWVNLNAFVGAVGTRYHMARYTPSSAFAQEVLRLVRIEVKSAAPNYVLPSASGALGDRLFEVGLPTGWIWLEANAVLDEVGVVPHRAVFLPLNANHHAIVREIMVSVL